MIFHVNVIHIWPIDWPSHKGWRSSAASTGCGRYLYFHLQSDILYGLVWKLFILYKLASYMVWCGRYLFLGDLFTIWHLIWFGVEVIHSWEVYLQIGILHGLVWKVFILGRFIYKLTSYIVEGRNPGSFQPPENTGSLLIEGCDRWNRTNFEQILVYH